MSHPLHSTKNESSFTLDMKYIRDSKMTLATVIYEINMLLVRVSQITTKKFSSSMFGKRDWMGKTLNNSIPR